MDFWIIFGLGTILTLSAVVVFATAIYFARWFVHEYRRHVR